MMNPKDAKKRALTELERLKKEVKGIDDLDKLESHLSHLPLFHRILYKSTANGALYAYYDCMTLKFFLKNDIIVIDEKVDLWNEDGTGYIGQFTPKTLQLECSDGLD